MPFSILSFFCIAALSVFAPLLHAADSLSLDAAMRIAVERSQQVTALQAQSRSAHEMSVAAGQLPDPVLKFGLNNYPVTRDEAFSLVREGMTMRSVGVMQELTRSDKREARALRAEREADAGTAAARQSEAATRRDAALAWFEVSYLETMRALLARQIDEAELQVQASDTAFRSARGGQADIYAARTVVERLRDQLTQMDRDIALARVQLERWIGEAAQQPLATRPDISQFSVSTRNAANHPVLDMADRQLALAEADAEVARRNRRSDWSVELMYGQRGPAFANVVSINFSVPLQWDRSQRQDRELAAKLAQVEQARALKEDAVRALNADARSAYASWQAAVQRMTRYEKSLLPLAENRMQAELTAFGNGIGSLGAVLEARRMAVDVRMERERVALDAARAWVQLEYLNDNSSFPRRREPSGFAE